MIVALQLHVDAVAVHVAVRLSCSVVGSAGTSQVDFGSLAGLGEGDRGAPASIAAV